MSLFERKKIHRRIKSHTELSFKKQIVFGVLRLCAVVLLFICIWYVTRLEVFAIREITVAGGETISHEEIQARLQDELQGTYFLIIPKRFSYLYPHDRMMTVLENVPRAYNVVIERTSKKSLHVTFDEHIPHALWCVSNRAEVPCLFVDTTGYAFAEAPSLLGGTLVRHSIEDADLLTPGIVIAEERLIAIDTFIGRTQHELGLRITALTHKKNGDIVFQVNGGGEILATETKNFETTFENLQSVLASKEFAHIAPGNFKYIDVRFDNKAFVNEEYAVASSTPTASTTASSSLPE